MFTGKLGDILICRGSAASAVHHDDGDICLLERTHRLIHHELADAGFTASDTTCVNHKIRNGPDLAITVLPVPGQSREIRDQRVARACQAIEERCFSHVGIARQGDAQRFSGRGLIS